MRILVVGAGAVGGYFGAMLARAGRDVTFLVRSGRAQQLRDQGLRIAAADQTIDLPAPVLAPAGEVGGFYDLVLLSVKAYALDDAIETLAPAVGPATIVVPLLNGLRHLDALVARFGDAAVFGGVANIATMLEADGVIHKFSTFPASLIYGERNGGITPRAEAVHAALSDAGFTATLADDMPMQMWRKWMPLAALGALNCLMRGNLAEVIAAGGTSTALGIYEECAGVASAAGFGPSAATVTEMRAFLSRDEPLTSSMYRDLLGGHRVEAEHIVGDLVARARGLGAATPLLDAALTNLRVYERRRSGR